MHNLKKQLSEIDTNQKKISEYRPYRTDFLPTLKNYYRVGIVYSSNAIEGITYTETETKVLIEDGLTAGGKPLSELYAVLGHAEAYNFMFDLASTTHKLTEADLLTLHKLVGGENGKGFSNDTVPGEYRKRAALISGSNYPLTSSALIPAEIRGMFEWIDSSREKYHPVEFAALLHKKLIFIHPFADGNGRVTRLVLNASLMQKGFVPTIIEPTLRTQYIDSLEKAHTDDTEFKLLIAGCVKRSQEKIIQLLDDVAPKRPTRRMKL